MIIKTFSYQETETAIKVRDLIESVAQQRVYLVPHGVENLFISIDEKANDNLIVYAARGAEDLDIARGFDRVSDCWKYAKVIAKEAGLSEDDIDADVWEVDNSEVEEEETLYTLISIFESRDGKFEVYGQGIDVSTEKMEFNFLGSFESLEEAKELGELEASSFDCPLVEILSNKRPVMRDVVEELG
jgi:hypothetical protein